MTSWTYPAISWSGQSIQLIIKMELYVCTVKPILRTTFLNQPPVLNNHIVIFPQVFRSNFSLYSDHLYNATNDHLNDIPGLLLLAHNPHCTKYFFLEVIRNSQDIFVLKLFIICCFTTT